MLHLVSAQEEDVAKAYKTVRKELEAYGKGIAEKPEIIALSQTDILDEETLNEKMQALEEAAGRKVEKISSIAGFGMKEMLRNLRQHIDKNLKEEAE
jgi:GTP-binding protein